MRDYKYYTCLAIFIVGMFLWGCSLWLPEKYLTGNTVFASKEKIVLKCPNCSKSIVCSGCGHILFLEQE